jgi:hypothetical protein
MKRLAFGVIVIWLALSVAENAALAQAGSTGGIVGKMNKGASGESDGSAGKPGPGGERAPASRDSGIEHRARSKVPVKQVEATKPKAAACARAVGTWFWVTEVVTIKPNGSITAKGGPGNWSCVNGLLHVFWPGFIVPHEIFSISDDGDRLISQNTSSAPTRIR